MNSTLIATHKFKLKTNIFFFIHLGIKGFLITIKGLSHKKFNLKSLICFNYYFIIKILSYFVFLIIPQMMTGVFKLYKHHHNIMGLNIIDCYKYISIIFQISFNKCKNILKL